eukprot:TRINITY_DN6543_c0_g1_i1.p1 TRINITY_DN6543_c0_g1~~TRINITY_DN6543_c0_g1_i1.p1  ORF type:complete len:406 (-),score=85.72 TRINITY_DN6543_c0_g1_i1:1647-2864(-)
MKRKGSQSSLKRKVKQIGKMKRSSGQMTKQEWWGFILLCLDYLGESKRREENFCFTTYQPYNGSDLYYGYFHKGNFLPSGQKDGVQWYPSRRTEETYLTKRYFYSKEGNLKFQRLVTWITTNPSIIYVEYRLDCNDLEKGIYSLDKVTTPDGFSFSELKEAIENPQQLLKKSKLTKVGPKIKQKEEDEDEDIRPKIQSDLIKPKFKLENPKPKEDEDFTPRRLRTMKQPPELLKSSSIQLEGSKISLKSTKKRTICETDEQIKVGTKKVRRKLIAKKESIHKDRRFNTDSVFDFVEGFQFESSGCLSEGDTDEEVITLSELGIDNVSEEEIMIKSSKMKRNEPRRRITEEEEDYNLQAQLKDKGKNSTSVPLGELGRDLTIQPTTKVSSNRKEVAWWKDIGNRKA